MLASCAAVGCTVISDDASAQQMAPVTVPGTDGVPMASGPPPMAFEPGQGAVWFEAPAGPYQVIVSPADGNQVVPDMAGHACTAPCGMHLPAGNWRVQTRWEGGFTGSDYMGIAAGRTVRRGYEHPQHNAFVPGAMRHGPTVSWQSGVGVALIVTGGLVTVASIVAMTVNASSSSAISSPVFWLGLAGVFIGPPVVIGGIRLVLVGSSGSGLAARNELRLAPVLAVNPEGAMAGVRVEF